MNNVQLLIIDPQIDFTSNGSDPNIPKGTLYVPGSEGDMERLATMIKRLRSKIDDIHVTLDSHHRLHIAHPMFWVNSQGKHPEPLVTVITTSDIKNGYWRTFNPAHQDRAYNYVKALEDEGRYILTIWPYHCIITTMGHAVHPILEQALAQWELEEWAMVDTVTKGSNFWTEHYSIVQAAVPDPADKTTRLNEPLIETIGKGDIILVAGEALNFCDKYSIEDIITNFSKEAVKKMVFLKDACSPVPVPGYEKVVADFKDYMIDKGVTFSTTTEVFN